MGYNRSLLAAAMLVLVVSAALGGEATRVLTSTYETLSDVLIGFDCRRNMGRNLESQVTLDCPDPYPWACGPVGPKVSGANDEG
ncbi:hypothetical protein ACJRO7_022037 [Eucalyptus globulus]|uniref:Uncharacterized protein n=1 Tax=Eucalyptus globulus TaxID=34317 RepID=A0ABD3KMQ6_EUCGL